MPVTLPHRVVVAPSGFKQCLSPEEVAHAIAVGVRRALPGAVVDVVPVVDGGEGTAQGLVAATGGELLPVRVTGPVGEPVDSHIGLLGGDARGTAVVEMAAAAGLRLVPPDLRNLAETTTYGVGELIRAALDAGASRLLVGCGDAGTCDGGAGALQALGARLLDRAGREIGRGGLALRAVDRVDLTGLDPRVAEVELLVACNTYNVLAGPRGVARVFGPRKSVPAEQAEQLPAALDLWAEVMRRDCAENLAKAGLDPAFGPGTGASGGLGAALAAGLGARLRPRFEILLDHVDLDALLQRADLVLTAEGAVDRRTAWGKVPAEIARRAKTHGKPVILLAGALGDDAANVYDVGVDAIVSVLPGPMPLSEAMTHAPRLVTEATDRALRLLTVGAAISASTDE